MVVVVFQTTTEIMVAILLLVCLPLLLAEVAVVVMTPALKPLNQVIAEVQEAVHPTKTLTPVLQGQALLVKVILAELQLVAQTPP